MKQVVSKDEHGWSLLKFLQEKMEGSFSARKIKQMIERKCCFVSGKMELFASRALAEGDLVEWRVLDLKQAQEEILFEDRDFLVLNKSVGKVCEPSSFSLGKLCHRLDKETSGVLIFAKTELGYTQMCTLFSERKIQKQYLAIVDGKVKPQQGCIDNLLAKKHVRKGQTIYGQCLSGLRAITEYKVISYAPLATLILAEIKTGRTHQIRVHFSEKGHPVLGDHQYGSSGFNNQYKAERHLLHAWRVSFIHPFSKQKIEIIAPLPADFQQAMKDLDLSCSQRDLIL